MGFWDDRAVTTLLVTVALLAAGGLLRDLLPPVRRLGVPACIVAGLLGLALGPSSAQLLPLDQGVLEALVYHGLAIIFIAGGLQRPAPSRGGGARAFMLGIPVMIVLQCLLGLGLILALDGLGTELHPGFGLILPLGFEEGPGQALSLGAAWEAGGMPNGAQVGLIVAALGFGWAIGGVALVAWGRARGLLWTQRSGAHAGSVATPAAHQAPPPERPGSLERMTVQLAVIGLCYLGTWGIVAGISAALAGAPDLAAMVWGFHFIVGALVALGLRAAMVRLGLAAQLDDGLLRRTSGVTVDVVTCAALAAIEIAVLTAHWVPILIITTAGGLLTAWASLWFASRAFRVAPFEHALLWYGMSTGTLPMGLALLRIVDPELRTPVDMNAVLGSALAVPLLVVPLMVIMPIAIAGFPERWPSAGWLAFGLYAAYLAALLVAWRLGATGRAARLEIGPPTALWRRPE